MPRGHTFFCKTGSDCEFQIGRDGRDRLLAVHHRLRRADKGHSPPELRGTARPDIWKDAFCGLFHPDACRHTNTQLGSQRAILKLVSQSMQLCSDASQQTLQTDVSTACLCIN